MKRNILLSIALLAAGAACAHAMTLTLDSCVSRAVETSEGLLSARNAVEQAGLQRQVARTAYMPSFSGSATGMFRAPDSDYMGMSLRMRSVYMAGINLQQPIYAGGKIIAANRLAEIGREAAAQQLRMTEMDVRAEAERAYWTYVAILAKVRMMQAYVAQIDTAYRQTRISLDAGMTTSNNLLRVEARRSQVMYQLGQVESGADLCRLSLCSMLHLDPDTPLDPADTDVDMPAIPADLHEYDLAARPETMLLDADVRAREQQVNMTRADFLPTLGMQAGWSAYGGIKSVGQVQAEDGTYYPHSSTIRGAGWSVMVSLSVPLWHWCEGIKKVKHARLDVENARLKLAESTRQMDLQVRQAIENVNTSRRLIEAAELAMAQADRNLANMTDSYRLGMATLTDYLDAQSQWQTSQADMIEARTQLRIYLVDYRRATARQ